MDLECLMVSVMLLPQQWIRSLNALRLYRENGFRVKKGKGSLDLSAVGGARDVY